MIEPWALGLAGSRVTLSCGSDRGSAVLWGRGREAPGVGGGERELIGKRRERRRVLSDITHSQPRCHRGRVAVTREPNRR